MQGGIIESDEVRIGSHEGSACEKHDDYSIDEEWLTDCPESDATETVSIETPTATSPANYTSTPFETPNTEEPIVITIPATEGPTPTISTVPDGSPSVSNPMLASVGGGGQLVSDNLNPHFTHINHKASYWIWWEDPVNIDVSGVSVAVRSNTSGSNITGAACLHQRKLYDPSNPVSGTLFNDGWRTSSTNPRFNDWGCEYSATYAQSTVGAHHYNNDFPACFGQTVHLYYEKTYVGVTNYPSQVSGYYYFGAWGVWKSGADYTCGPLLSGEYRDHMPGEYFRAWPD